MHRGRVVPNSVGRYVRSSPEVTIMLLFSLIEVLKFEAGSISLSKNSLVRVLSLGIHIFVQSQWVMVLASKKFLSLDETRSIHPRNFSVSLSHGLNIHEIYQSRWVAVLTSKKFLSLNIQHITQSRWVLISTSTKYQSLVVSLSQQQPIKRNPIETRIFSASISSLRLNHFQFRFRQRDFRPFLCWFRY